MTEVTSRGPVSLDDVRARFEEAEEQLSKAAQTLDRLQTAIEALNDAKLGLRSAGEGVGRVGEIFEASLQSLARNLELLREGVDALKKAEPEQMMRQIAGVQETVLASQSLIENRTSELGERFGSGLQRFEDQAGHRQFELNEQLTVLRREVGLASSEHSAAAERTADVVKASEAGVTSAINGLQKPIAEVRTGITESRTLHAAELARLQSTADRTQVLMTGLERTQGLHSGKLDQRLTVLTKEQRIVYVVLIILLAIIAYGIWRT